MKSRFYKDQIAFVSIFLLAIIVYRDDIKVWWYIVTGTITSLLGAWRGLFLLVDHAFHTNKTQDAVVCDCHLYELWLYYPKCYCPLYVLLVNNEKIVLLDPRAYKVKEKEMIEADVFCQGTKVRVEYYTLSKTIVKIERRDSE